ncbi:MAG: DUF4062 domain-containing protein [Pseudomonadales bacterium]|nr:DUF4062 domain-containing protein [Pseudomonadales bacterium]
MRINKQTSHPSAFISSTFADLKHERRSVSEALRSREINRNALDTNPASTNNSKQEIIKGIRQSDFVILIVGGRYGSILPSMTGSSSISITHWEYNLAMKCKKSVLVFLQDGAGYDKNEPISHNKRLDNFKKILHSRHDPKYFDTKEELASLVDAALISVYRNMADFHSSSTDAFRFENNELRNKITALETQLKSSQQTTATPYGLTGLSSLLNN